MTESATSGSHSQWFLTEIKNGVEEGRHPLQTPFTVLGRSDDVDIFLAHESCSRKHAMIQLDPVSITDYSTHGTFVDRRKIQEATPLKIGDVLQFGASTRLYFLEGPSDEAQPSSPQHEENTPVMTDKQSAAGDERQQKEEEEEERPRSLDLSFRDESKIPSQHQKEWERLKANKYKLDNIQLESERIRVKGELTAGQERQLERNQDKEARLQEQLQEAEESLLRKLYPDTRPVHSAERNSYLRDEEEVEDRTQHDETSNGDAETEASLTITFKSTYQQIESLDQALSVARESLTRTNDRLDTLQATEDEDEIFFAQNDVALAQEVLRKLTDDQRTLETTLNETVRLLKVVNPKLAVDPVTGHVGSALLSFSSQKVHQSQASSAPKDANFSMPPPSTKQNHIEFSCGKQKGDFGVRMLPPPPKRARVAGPSLPLTDDSASLQSSGRDDSQPRFPSSNSSVTNPRQPSKTTAPSANALKGFKGVDFTASQPAKELGKPFMGDGQTDTWQAPKDQDGSGKTKLNEKFAGRY